MSRMLLAGAALFCLLPAAAPPTPAPARSIWSRGNIDFRGPRAESYHDRDGITSGLAHQLKEYTVTGEYRLSSWAVTRLEFRRDGSNQPYFDRGHGLGNARQQHTLLTGYRVIKTSISERLGRSYAQEN